MDVFSQQPFVYRIIRRVKTCCNDAYAFIWKRVWVGNCLCGPKYSKRACVRCIGQLEMTPKEYDPKCSPWWCWINGWLEECSESIFTHTPEHMRSAYFHLMCTLDFVCLNIAHVETSMGGIALPDDLGTPSTRGNCVLCSSQPATRSAHSYHGRQRGTPLPASIMSECSGIRKPIRYAHISWRQWAHPQYEMRWKCSQDKPASSRTRKIDCCCCLPSQWDIVNEYFTPGAPWSSQTCHICMNLILWRFLQAGYW